jgi:cytochrome c
MAMRGIWTIAAGLGAAALLSGCGKSQAPVMPTPQSAAPEASSAPSGPAPLTDAQKKMLSALPAPFNTADPAAGQQKFALCSSCHTIAKGGPNLTGPNLYGVFGTKAAQIAGFDFSDGLKKSGLTYDAATLDKWINDPKILVPETKMTFAGIKDAKDRADVVAYVAIQRDQ